MKNLDLCTVRTVVARLVLPAVLCQAFVICLHYSTSLVDMQGNWDCAYCNLYTNWAQICIRTPYICIPSGCRCPPKRLPAAISFRYECAMYPKCPLQAVPAMNGLFVNSLPQFVANLIQIRHVTGDICAVWTRFAPLRGCLLLDPPQT